MTNQIHKNYKMDTIRNKHYEIPQSTSMYFATRVRRSRVVHLT
jgi:hypothetical protein